MDRTQNCKVYVRILTLTVLAVVAGAGSLYAADVEQMPYPGIDTVPYLLADEVNAHGEVVGADHDNVFIMEKDTVFVNFHTGAQVDDVFAVVRQSEDEIEHPTTGSDVGYLVEVMGLMVVKSIDEEFATGEITRAFKDIKRGDLLLPYEKSPQNIELKKNFAAIDGTVVAVEELNVLAGSGDIVFIDRGANNGVEVGNTFEVYTAAENIDTQTDEDELPDVILGEIVILRTTETTATGLLKNCTHKIGAGAKIRIKLD